MTSSSNRRALVAPVVTQVVSPVASSVVLSAGAAPAVNLWTDPPDTIETGWVDAGGGVYQALFVSDVALKVNGPPVEGETYRVTFTMQTVAAGAVEINVGGTVSDNSPFNTVATHTDDVVCGSSTGDGFRLMARSGYLGIIKDISIYLL